MRSEFKQPRPRGTGSLLRHTNRSGGESWYGKWRLVDGQQVMQRLGPVRTGSSRDGMTRAAAEAALRRAMVDRDGGDSAPTDGVTVGVAGARLLERLTALGRKRSTLADYESTIRVHLAPFFAERALSEIDVDLVELFIAAKQQEGKATKSIQNYVGLLHSIFTYGLKRDWCDRNPAALADKPVAPRGAEIRFLTIEELDAILAATPATELGRTDRRLFLTAAMTGMRRGEVVAVRWQDVDWSARVIRVRRNFTRGEFGTPKTRRSARAVPLASRLAHELERHYSETPYRHDLDLVFPHPATGAVLDPSKLRKRFQSAARRASVRPVRFHDLRHTFGTQMAAAGAPLRAIQEWMGHSDYRTTSIYADYALDPHEGARFAEKAFEPSGYGRPERLRPPRMISGAASLDPADPGARRREPTQTTSDPALRRA